MSEAEGLRERAGGAELRVGLVSSFYRCYPKHCYNMRIRIRIPCRGTTTVTTKRRKTPSSRDGDEHALRAAGVDPRRFGAAEKRQVDLLLAHWAIDALIAERRGTDRGRDGIRR